MARLRILLALDWYDYRIHRGVARVAARLGWDLVCTHSSASQPLIPAGWDEDGVVALVGDHEQGEHLACMHCPVVDVGLFDHGQSFPRMVVDNDAVGRLAAEHVLERGFTSVWVERPPGDSAMFYERYMGLKQAMKSQGGTVRHLDGMQSFFDAMSETPQAVVGWVDEIAIQWMDRVLDAGFRVPEDCAVLGIDDRELTCFSREVPLSSIRSDQEGLGVSAAELLHRCLSESVPETIYRHAPQGIAVRGSTDTFTATHPVVKQALEWIDAHIAERINAAQLAAFLNLTPQGLQGIFRAHFHMSPGSAIRHHRIQRAKQALRNGHKLNRVAQECGYASVDALCRHFRSAVGQSPGQWRKAQGAISPPAP